MGVERLEEKVMSNGSDDDPSRVDLNDLMKKVREEEKKSKRANVYFSAVAVSAIAVIGVVLTL